MLFANISSDNAFVANEGQTPVADPGSLLHESSHGARIICGKKKLFQSDGEDEKTPHWKRAQMEPMPRQQESEPEQSTQVSFGEYDCQGSLRLCTRLWS